MPRTCGACGHESRAAIDEALVMGEPLRNIAQRFGTSATALHRHKADHLPATLVKAKQAEEVARADDLLVQVENLHERTLAILESAEETGELRAALSAIREARNNLELLARLVGELDERPVVNVVLIDAQVRDAIVLALAPYGEARLAVANALEPFEDGS